MKICKICDKEFDSNRKLSKHFRDSHRISSIDYYRKYLGDDTSGKCKYCGEPTLFETISSGFKSYCTAHRGFAIKDFRAKLKQDSEKFKNFTEKVSANQSKIWQDRFKSGEDAIIRNKISNTVKQTFTAMSDEIRREKYGWFNKLTEDQKETWKNEIMFATGMHKWWKTATDEQIQTVIKKRMTTMINSLESSINDYKMDPSDYVKYSKAVWYYTTQTYFKHKDIIDPNGIRSIEWHLDHKYSVKAGFINGVEPKIIGSKENLCILSRFENCTKNAKCSITLKELLEATSGQI
jgi:hypothetical protein